MCDVDVGRKGTDCSGEAPIPCSRAKVVLRALEHLYSIERSSLEGASESHLTRSRYSEQRAHYYLCRWLDGTFQPQRLSV
jgi:hypothetical protein